VAVISADNPSANLVRFGLSTQILDERVDKTSTGRADGLQPKSIETLRQMRLADPLLQRGVRIYDICFWSGSAGKPLRRTGREVHYPPNVDVLDPYILLVHQGMIEELFLDDLAQHGVQVARNSVFMDYEVSKQMPDSPTVTATYQDAQSGASKTVATQFLVGTDGAHSQVRKSMPGVQAVGRGSEAIWGVLDGVLDTNFPDLWSKVVIHSEDHGSVLCIPRERNMTRLYIELRGEGGEAIPKARQTQEFVMHRAQQIMQPYRLAWATVGRLSGSLLNTANTCDRVVWNIQGRAAGCFFILRREKRGFHCRRCMWACPVDANLAC